MQAIDTNVIVRYLVADDPGQYEIAANVIEGGPVFVPLTVLLETEWVLRDVYEIANQDVVRQLLAFSQLPGVTLEGGDRAQRALAWARSGMDFADALHLAGAGECERFATFDRDLAKAARRLGVAVNELRAP